VRPSVNVPVAPRVSAGWVMENKSAVHDDNETESETE
jgi:hypothetical protein